MIRFMCLSKGGSYMLFVTYADNKEQVDDYNGARFN